MARDRLAAMRNDHSGYRDRDEFDSYNDPPAAPAYRLQPSNNIRSTRPSQSTSSSFDDEKPDYDDYYHHQPTINKLKPRQDNPHQPPIELGPVKKSKSNPNQDQDQKGPREVSSTEEFFDAISNLQVDLKELQHLITEIDDLSKRSLDSSHQDREQAQDEINHLGDEIRNLSSQLKHSIQTFEADHSLLRQRGDPDGNLSVRMDQLAALKKRFVETVQRYAQVEQNSRKAMKARIERQVRIVKPDASEAEIQAAVEDEASGTGAVFQQALMSSNRMGSARNALKEVQSRAADIKRIEQTITELAQLFNDMATMVEEQDVHVQHIEKQAEVVHQDVEAATQELKQAVVSAKGARSKRKCCFVIILILILLIGGGVAVYVLIKTGVIGGTSTAHSNASTNATASNAPSSSSTTKSSPS
ncbi:hypothetical protein O181_094801 [Austropuccinia psidii MF-1]|uniref:t-SNARE coiled-coil homology domain-containing protein n=1 Tax=Austropuccinia psidii MF-1 TaxID=1389203 RepID=A0A9Q3J3X6_9BASI|nr:hypothetical protein [Austropuccinia psidii MF-1]